MFGRMMLMAASNSAAADAWTPAQITTALWLDAADSATITTVSGAVSQWNDKSGNSRNATQSTAGSRPLLTTVSGYPVIQFDGTDDWMTIAASFFPSGAPSNVSFIIAAVVKENNGGSGGVISTNAGGVSNSGCGIMINSSRRYDVFPPIVSTASTGASRSVLTGVNAAGPGSIYVNGTLENSGSYAYTVVNATFTTLGRYRTGDGYYGAFDLSELVVCVNTGLAATRQYLEGYLAWRWGLTASLPAGHPYKNAAP